MQALTFIIVGMTTFAFVLLGVAGWLYQLGVDENENARIKTRLGVMTTEEIESDDIASLIRDEASDSIQDALGAAGDKIQLTLQQAGSDLTVSQFIMQCAALGFITSLISITFLGPTTFMTGFGAAYAPWARMSSRAEKRARSLLDQMPDGLDLMGRAMQAGTGLSDTFLLVQKELPDPISTDFGRVYESVRFGKEWRDVLGELIERNPSIFDLRLFVSALILQRETGGNTIETVNRISKLIRQRAVFDAKVKAMSAEARMSGLVLAGMPVGVAILMFIFSPAYLAPLVTTAFGQIISVLCVTAYAVGIIVMRQVSKIEV